ncbi:MAG TPA: glycosyltransferase family 9 protein [Syntrophales bacterium]|nr:glycosyltransferase family 9 protein [Syntrophales bacterium]HOX93655.1 glycosyltransferase family 9 protein [Syntrophales bacterium]HPI57383.1 glycosyltransferase family 9 protein [Syntrophales bacterium]HPN25447.1 glycosyltransferase family 9 protein [Syntrophales bacterium]HQM29929.1 glycosyltransferase family 9 protein [Syntrophales bacterium]
MDTAGPEKINILIVKLSAIGDVVHTLPSLAALRTLYPLAHITWVVEETSSDLLVGHPDLDRLLISKRKKWLRDLANPTRARGALRETLAFLRTLRDRPYDLVIDFHGLFKSGLIVLLSGARRKLGYDSMQELSGLFLNEKIPEDMEKHAVDRYLDFLRHLGAKAGEPRFYIPVGVENRSRVDTLLEAEGIGRGERFVAVSPVALWDTKLWEEKKFAMLCDRVLGELGLKVVLTGSRGDGILQRIEKAMTRPVANLGGKTSLRDLAYLFERSSLVITTDSGPMHIAAAAGTPVVALFGPTSPSRTGPYGKGHRVIRKEIGCSPCFLKKCDVLTCMKEITVDEVFEAVKDKLPGQEA